MTMYRYDWAYRQLKYLIRFYTWLGWYDKVEKTIRLLKKYV